MSCLEYHPKSRFDDVVYLRDVAEILKSTEYIEAKRELIRFKLGDMQIIQKYAKKFTIAIIGNLLGFNSQEWVLLQRQQVEMPLPHSRNLLEEEVAKQLGIPLSQVLQTKEVVQWSFISEQSRQMLSKHLLFLKNEDDVKEKKILLLDDVWVTGSFVRQTVKLLQDIGIKKHKCFIMFDARRHPEFEPECYEYMINSMLPWVFDNLINGKITPLTHTAAKFMIRLATDFPEKFKDLLNYETD